MDQKAEELAQAFLNANKESFEKSFPIRSNGNQTSEEIVVIVRKIKRPFVNKFKEAVKRYIPSASGGQCPTCNGTGRV